MNIRKAIILSLVIFLCLPAKIWSLSIGRTETVGKEEGEKISIETEFIFDKEIKAKSLLGSSGSWSGDVSTQYQGLDIDWIGVNASYSVNVTGKPDFDRLYRQEIKLIAGVSEDLDLYVTLGASQGKLKGGDINIQASGSVTDVQVEGVSLGSLSGVANGYANWKYDIKDAFLYGGGIKGVYPLDNDWFLGADASYIRHKNSYSGTLSYSFSGALSSIIAGTTSGQGSETWKGKMTFDEWQFAPYIAKKIDNFIPYLGVKYSYLRLKDKSSLGTYKYKADDNFGVFLGTDYKIDDNLVLNIEGRFINETAVSLCFAVSY